MGSGVTGNTADSGSVIQGSIPCSPARPSVRSARPGRHRRPNSNSSPWCAAPVEPARTVHIWSPRVRAGRPVRLTRRTAIVTDRNSARSSSGLGHHPLKVAARVRIPYGLPRKTSSEACETAEPSPGHQITPDLHPSEARGPRPGARARGRSASSGLPRREGRMKGTIRVRENRDGSKSYVCQVKLGRDPGTGKARVITGTAKSERFRVHPTGRCVRHRRRQWTPDELLLRLCCRRFTADRRDRGSYTPRMFGWPLVGRQRGTGADP